MLSLNSQAQAHAPGHQDDTMKFSENWLRSHVLTGASRDELSAVLTAIGLEVEDVTALGEGLDHVVVARIVDAVRHPEADRLQVCRVDAGQGELLQIVCGAPNARPGLVAPLAMVGAQIGELKIKPAKLRGVESNGMLCSAKELGLDNDASGLLELPDDAPVGQTLVEYLGLPDASIEIKLTPNRADCFSLRGIAYDVAAATRSEVLDFAADAIPAVGSRELGIQLDAGAEAPRYLGRVIEGVNAAARTPLWMAERLRRSGVRPVSLLVDITQYVMLELGQPMHAYDLGTLQGSIAVRRSRAGETLKLLDGRDAALDDSFLVVTDADRAVGLAGLMGGFDTRVTDATTAVFLEARTSRRPRSWAVAASWACTPMPAIASSAASIRRRRAPRSSTPPAWCWTWPAVPRHRSPRPCVKPICRSRRPSCCAAPASPACSASPSTMRKSSASCARWAWTWSPPPTAGRWSRRAAASTSPSKKT
jgi:phenylalanyl-tRNA synthetase beta chain